MSRPTRVRYSTTSWPEYNAALKRRGSLTIWLDPQMQWGATPGRRGRQQIFSDAAIQACLTMKVLFGMALRQATGFVESLLQLIGLDGKVLDFSTLCRRQRRLVVEIASRRTSEPLHLLIYSTGIKVEGEGEGHTRKHGASSRRVWRKIHLSVDERTLEVCAVEVTSSNVGDAPMLPELLDQIPADQEIGSVTADGAYEARKCHETIAGLGRMGSSRHARTPDLGKPTPSAPGRETTFCAPPYIWAGRCGGDGAIIIAEVASKPG